MLFAESMQITPWPDPRASIEAVSKPKPTKILVYGLNYAPELTGIGKYTAELCSWLASRGHIVKVVAGHPYYPDWAVAESYDNSKYQTEFRDGVEVVHCPLFIPTIPTSKKRILNHLSFSITSAPKLIEQALRFRPDVIFCVAPSFFVAPAAIIAGSLSGARRWLHVQDFEIDSAFELGMLAGGHLRRLAATIETSVFRRFNRVSSISPKMVASLVRKGVDAAKTVEFRNWVDTDAIRPLDRMTDYRKQLGLTSKHIVALYSGSIAAKQGIESLVVAARTILEVNRDLVFVFCGNGAMRGQLLAAAAGLPNIKFLDLQPENRMPELLATADIHLIPQRAQVANLMLPSKLGPILSSGRPAVVMADAKTQLAIELDGAGLAVPPADQNALVNAILQLANDEALRQEMGITGRALACSRWDKNAILAEFERRLIEMSLLGAPVNDQTQNEPVS